MDVHFYVRAGTETGWGHLFRCLALADELRTLGADCTFLTEPGAIERVARAGFEAFAFDANLSPFPGASVTIVDLEGGCPPDVARRVRQACDVFVILNGVGYPDGDPGRLLADLVFYQGVTRRPYRLDWSGFEGQWFEGIKWTILRREFYERCAAPYTAWEPYKVVILGGGSDPRNVTRTVIDALVGSPELQLRAVVGPSNRHAYDDLRVEFVRDPPHAAEAMAWANAAVVSYGMTAFECLALGLPTVALSISSDHAISAMMLQAQAGGAFISLGELGTVLDLETTDEATRFLTRGAGNAVLGAVNIQAWRQEYLSQIARQIVDGRGACRVAGKIMEVANVAMG